MAKTFKTAALALSAAGVLASAAPALAHDTYNSYPGAQWSQQSEGWNHSDRYGDRYRDRNDGGYGYNGGYYERRGYDEPVYQNTRTWRGDDGRNYCRRQDGTTGLLVGGIAGGVIGHEIAGRRGDRTLGAILGAGVGALLGREIDKSSSNGRCR
jgi:opacity protein-like surface antigen